MDAKHDVTYTSREERLAAARAKYQEVMTTSGPEPVKPYYDAGVVGFVFGEMWPRPGLSRRDRRWVTLACVGAMGAVIPIQTHVYAALNSGDCALEEIEGIQPVLRHTVRLAAWAGGRPVRFPRHRAARPGAEGTRALGRAGRVGDATGPGPRRVRGDHVRPGPDG